jgi:hypothetical protein
VLHSRGLTGTKESVDLGALCAWLAPTLDVDLHADHGEGSRRVVAASDWLTMEGGELLTRLSLQNLGQDYIQAGPLLRVLRDPEGRVLGRAAIFPRSEGAISYPGSLGVITVGGLRADSRSDGTVGILVGSAVRATRDRARRLASNASLAYWASDQALLIAENISDPSLQFDCAAVVMAYGGNPGTLPIAKRGRALIDGQTLATWTDAPDEIIITPLNRGSGYEEDLELHPMFLALFTSPATKIFYIIFEQPWPRHGTALLSR